MRSRSAQHWRRYRQMVKTALQAGGLSGPAVDAWLAVEPEHDLPQDQAQMALMWTAEFGDNAPLAVQWHNTNVCLEDAAAWAARGYTAAEANEVNGELMMQGLMGGKRPVDLPTDWRDSGLPRDWVVQCVRQGLRQVSQGQVLYDAARQLFDEA